MKYDYGIPARGLGVEHIHFYDSLVGMGHEVIPFHFDMLMEEHGRTRMNQLLLELVDQTDPDCLFTCLYTDQFDPAVIQEISLRRRTKTINWCCDDHWRFQYTGGWAPNFNYMITTSAKALSLYEQIQYPHVIKSQWGCNTRIHTKKDMPKIYDVSFIGGTHGNRIELIQTLQRAGINIYVRGHMWSTGGVTHEEMCDIFNQSKIVLNFSKASNGNIVQIKARDFEGPACGSLFLTEYNEELKEYYEFEKEIVTYKGQEELMKIIRYYLDHDQEREQIANAGYERAVRDHNYTNRFRDIFRQMGLAEDTSCQQEVDNKSYESESSQRSTVNTISLCMIVKNEEETLERCLSSVQGIADEIIIIDTGSTDRTKEVAHQFTDKVYDFKWIDDFAAARNYSFAQATQDYILWLDADDVFEEVDRQKLMTIKANLDPSIDSVMMNYHLSFDAKGSPTFTLRRNRLVKRARNFVWIGVVHEYLNVEGRTLISDIAVAHKKRKAHTDRNLRIYLKRYEAGEIFSPRDVYYYANELRDHTLYEQAAEMYEKFWALQQGWIEDRISSCIKLAQCYSHLGKTNKQLQVLLRSFALANPRAEVCCQLGAYFLGFQKWDQARYWYEAAIRAADQPDTGGIVNTASKTWLPHVQLCLCYDRLGNHEKAYQHNEIARSYQPDHPSIIYNKNYLEPLLASKSSKV